MLIFSLLINFFSGLTLAHFSDIPHVYGLQKGLVILFITFLVIITYESQDDFDDGTYALYFANKIPYERIYFFRVIGCSLGLICLLGCLLILDLFFVAHRESVVPFLYVLFPVIFSYVSLALLFQIILKTCDSQNPFLAGILIFPLYIPPLLLSLGEIILPHSSPSLTLLYGLSLFYVSFSTVLLKIFFR